MRRSARNPYTSPTNSLWRLLGFLADLNVCIGYISDIEPAEVTRAVQRLQYRKSRGFRY